MDGVLEVVWPPAFGRHLIQLAKQQHAGARRFALRHGLAHVLGGHTENASADDGHWSGFEERVADLFACMDVLPDWRLEQLHAAGYDDQAIDHWCYQELSAWTCDWDPERLRDRVWLRLSPA